MNASTAARITVVQAIPQRRVTVDPRHLSPSYYYVDGKAVPHTALGRQFLESAYREDEAAGYCMDYVSMRLNQPITTGALSDESI